MKPRRRIWGGLWAAGLWGVTACATLGGEDGRPVLVRSTERLGPNGKNCAIDRPTVVDKGRPPAGTRPIAEVVFRSKRPLPLARYEEVLPAELVRFCADGVTMRRAVAADGATGFVEVVVSVWASDPT